MVRGAIGSSFRDDLAGVQVGRHLRRGEHVVEPEPRRARRVGVAGVRGVQRTVAVHVPGLQDPPYGAGTLPCLLPPFHPSGQRPDGSPEPGESRSPRRWGGGSGHSHSHALGSKCLRVHGYPPTSSAWVHRMLCRPTSTYLTSPISAVRRLPVESIESIRSCVPWTTSTGAAVGAGALHPQRR